MRTVTGEEAAIKGRKALRVTIGTANVIHDFWLADIQDMCIVGLDLLTQWRARVDVSSPALCVGMDVLPLRMGRGKKKARLAHLSNGLTNSHGQAPAAPAVATPMLTKAPSPETVQAIKDLYQRSSNG